MNYPAKFEKLEQGFCVTFRDVPEAITQGENMQEAVEMAQDALLTAMSFYYEFYRPIPLPSKCLKGEVNVPVAPSAWLKIMLYNEMINQRIKKSQMARILGVKPQQITRLFDFKRSSNLDTVCMAFEKLGKQIKFEIINH